MRVEQAKSDRSDTARQQEKATSLQRGSAATAMPAKAPEVPNQGAFSKILDSTRQASDTERSEKRSTNTDGDSTVEKSGDGKTEDSVESKAVRREDERQFSDQNSDGGDENHAWAPAFVPVTDGSSDTIATAPPARAILHVADLERIVSAVRSDSFAGSKQVTIDLKNSVLDGLRIQLTLTEQGTLKAEFLALNEQIKKQLDARKVELQSVLKDRSIKLRELNISVVRPDAPS